MLREGPKKTKSPRKSPFLSRISPFVFPNLTKTLRLVSGFKGLGKFSQKNVLFWKFLQDSSNFCKIQHVLYFLNAGGSRISNMTFQCVMKVIKVMKVMRISLHICISLYFTEFLCILLHVHTFLFISLHF